MQVVAALIVEGSRVLVCQRSAAGSFPLKWEFPGGKVEPGEGLLEALSRELKEELGIDVPAAEEIYRRGHTYREGAAVELIFFRVDRYGGAIENRVFQDLGWAEIPQLPQFDFLDGDLPLIERLVSQGLPR